MLYHTNTNLTDFSALHASSPYLLGISSVLKTCKHRYTKRLYHRAMASITLDLGRLLLTHIADKLKLTASCVGTFQVPYSIAALNHGDILHAFQSGHIYTTRGIGCSLDIKVLSEGKPLDFTTRDVLLDKLSKHLLDSEVSSISADTLHG